MEGELHLGFGISNSLLEELANSLLEELANLLEELANLLNGLFGLLMAFKVNFDPTIGFLMSNMSSMPSFRPFGGLIWPFLAK